MTLDIYTSADCIYCTYAKQLLNKKEITFTEWRIDENAELYDDMLARKSGLRSVPKIFMQDTYIGDYNKLVLLNANDALEAMIEKSKLVT